MPILQLKRFKSRYLQYLKKFPWKEMSLLSKIIYYMQPFVVHLINTWLQPLPFPTLFKFLYSLLLIVIILLPIIYPILIILCYYAIIQYLVESDISIEYPKKFDVINYVSALFNRVENDKYATFVNLYVERWRYIITALASCIDYMRLALSLLIEY